MLVRSLQGPSQEKNEGKVLTVPHYRGNTHRAFIRRMWRDIAQASTREAGFELCEENAWRKTRCLHQSLLLVSPHIKGRKLNKDKNEEETIKNEGRTGRAYKNLNTSLSFSLPSTFCASGLEFSSRYHSFRHCLPFLVILIFIHRIQQSVTS